VFCFGFVFKKQISLGLIWVYFWSATVT